MAKKSTKPTTKSKTPKAPKTTQATHGIRPSVGIIFTLFIALFIAITFGVVAYNQLRTTNTNLASAKLAVFDHLASEYIRDHDVTDNDVSEFYQMTGYGVSDEDGVFYITFDFADPASVNVTIDENGNMSAEDLKHGIMYFWKDDERGTYSHAYSYHDDNYHPSGTYVTIKQ